MISFVGFNSVDGRQNVQACRQASYSGTCLAADLHGMHARETLLIPLYPCVLSSRQRCKHEVKLMPKGVNHASFREIRAFADWLHSLQRPISFLVLNAAIAGAPFW